MIWETTIPLIMAFSTLSLAIAAILATVSVSQGPDPLVPLGCGDIKITCADRDRSCCEGACCQLLERFQFMATPSPLVVVTDAPAAIDAVTARSANRSARYRRRCLFRRLRAQGREVRIGCRLRGFRRASQRWALRSGVGCSCLLWRCLW